jgi:hypothetical protein
MGPRARARLTLFGLVALAVAIWAVSRLGDDPGVENALERSAEALSARPGEDAGRHALRLVVELRPLLDEQVHVNIAQSFVGDGRERVLDAAAGWVKSAHPVLRLDHVDAVIDDASHAHASFQVVSSDSQIGDLHAETRRARAALMKDPAGWRVVSLEVEPAGHPEPEPRP